MLQEKLNKLALAAANRSDIVLAVLVVSIIFMMILPLPTLLVDILIATNMSLSAILLMVSMYLPSPLAFSSFPSVLLVTTIFRLALSISTTRLILLNGDAGHIVDTFGQFVVGGNLVVGLVVFLIITIVQFVVITKGSERVAEVAARFSLDAMPGKQMSIDGDMRAGTIDMNEAKRRRNIVEKESQLYGAMDGAMKFVKGDAIAGLIIVAVNLLGGILIGTMQKGLEAGVAAKVYSILTIGDGLISQIPALFISITAGIIVTRVTDDEAGTKSNVGRDIGTQIMGQPRALLIGSGIMFGFAMIPGMPTSVFLILATVIGGLGYVLFKSGDLKAKLAEAAGVEKKDGENEDNEDDAMVRPTVPLLVEIHEGLKDIFTEEAANEMILQTARALRDDLGVPYPPVEFRYSAKILEETYCILLHEIPIHQGVLKTDYVLARESKEHLHTLEIPFEEGANFLPGIDTLWVSNEYADKIEQSGMAFLDGLEIISYHLGYFLRKHAADFLGVQETRALLNALESKLPDLTKEVQRVLSMQLIGETLQRLVSEDISIRNMRVILEALIDKGQREKDSVLLTEYVRIALKRYICFKYGTDNLMPAYLLDQGLEETVRSSIRQTSSGNYLALDPGISKQFVEKIIQTVGRIDPTQEKRPVLITAMDIRRYVRKLIEPEIFDLPVLSYQELTSETNVQPIDWIKIS
jgi:type III secretion protein V